MCVEVKLWSEDQEGWGWCGGRGSYVYCGVWTGQWCEPFGREMVINLLEWSVSVQWCEWEVL